MSELIILTKEQAEANHGEYKPFHEVLPIKITEDFYILNRDLSEVPELKEYRKAILSAPYFVPGDGSKHDIIYQQYLLDAEK